MVCCSAQRRRGVIMWYNVRRPNSHSVWVCGFTPGSVLYCYVEKVNSRMYCLRKLRAIGVNTNIVATSYNAAICTLIMFRSVCWGGNISKHDRGRLEKIGNKASRIIGRPLDTFEAFYDKRLIRKNDSHTKWCNTPFDNMILTSDRVVEVKDVCFQKQISQAATWLFVLQIKHSWKQSLLHLGIYITIKVMVSCHLIALI